MRGQIWVIGAVLGSDEGRKVKQAPTLSIALDTPGSIIGGGCGAGPIAQRSQLKAQADVCGRKDGLVAGNLDAQDGTSCTLERLFWVFSHRK